MYHIRLEGRTALSLLAIAIAALCTSSVTAQDYARLSRSDLKTLQASFADLVENVRPSVVAVRTYHGMRPFSQGAGVIFRHNGFILTNYHVIEDAPRVVVVLDGGMEYEAVIMQVDSRSDLAVIKIDARGLRAATFSHLSKVRIGHWTLAVGNPFGLSNETGTSSFSIGNVSSLGRNLTQELDYTDSRYYGNLIETSAAINPGNSGGPLFNIDGQVIGIVSAIETRSGVNEGVGFAVPISDRTLQIINTLARGEEVRYGFLGVNIEEPPADQLYTVGTKSVRGAMIGAVEGDSPAERARLRRDDIIIELAGTAIENADHLVRTIGTISPGDDISIRYVRRGRQRTTQTVLADRLVSLSTGPEDDQTFIPTVNWRGAWFTELTDDNRLTHGVEAPEGGIMVVDVRPGSDAAKRGLEPKQVILSVNGKPVRTLQQFKQARDADTDTIHLLLNNHEVIKVPRG